MYREQMLENKLANLQRLLSDSQAATDSNMQVSLGWYQLRRSTYILSRIWFSICIWVFKEACHKKKDFHWQEWSDFMRVYHKCPLIQLHTQIQIALYGCHKLSKPNPNYTSLVSDLLVLCVTQGVALWRNNKINYYVRNLLMSVHWTLKYTGSSLALSFIYKISQVLHVLWLIDLVTLILKYRPLESMVYFPAQLKVKEIK